MEGWPSPTFCASCDGENKIEKIKKKKKKMEDGHCMESIKVIYKTNYLDVNV